MSKCKVTLIKSVIGAKQFQKACIIGLGLRRISTSAIVDANCPCIKGMIRKVRHLISIENIL